MKKIEEIKRKLKEIKPYLRERFEAKEIGVFGSFLKRRTKKKSDIDILIEFKEEPSFFNFLELEEHLSKILKRKVDLVIKSTLKRYIGKQILKEVIYI